MLCLCARACARCTHFVCLCTRACASSVHMLSVHQVRAHAVFVRMSVHQLRVSMKPKTHLLAIVLSASSPYILLQKFSPGTHKKYPFLSSFCKKSTTFTPSLSNGGSGGRDSAEGRSRVIDRTQNNCCTTKSNDQVRLDCCCARASTAQENHALSHGEQCHHQGSEV